MYGSRRMAALAESLVDEWLNRQGFFTVRGLKHGADEMRKNALRGIEPMRRRLGKRQIPVVGQGEGARQRLAGAEMAIRARACRRP
jgi:hypothetical protein